MYRPGILRAAVLAAAIGAVFAVASALAENIDPSNAGAQYAWGENVGWINAEPGGNAGPGVQVSGMWLTGYMWGENIGWINLNCQNSDPQFDDICLPSNTSYYGVYNNGIGSLRGYAWSENAGWISFSCQNNPSTCASTGNYGVTIDPATGIWSGSAWGENIGWINFSHNQNGNRIKTADDGDGIAWPADNCPFDSNPSQINTDAVNTSLVLPGTDSLGDACDPDDDGDGCHDLEEDGVVPDPDPGLEPEFGGDRNKLYPWDFYDVTGDQAIDLSDTVAILTHFGQLPADAGYSPRYDRQAPGPKKYQTQAAAGSQLGIDLTDALINLQSFGHSCAGPLLP